METWIRDKLSYLANNRQKKEGCFRCFCENKDGRGTTRVLPAALHHVCSINVVTRCDGFSRTSSSKPPRAQKAGLSEGLAYLFLRRESPCSTATFAVIWMNGNMVSLEWGVMWPIFLMRVMGIRDRHEFAIWYIH
ncbi:hypothetical protein N782_21170 [Pontibacillus yanchengensis Y32]|uniref:Uncharacterized protein n=1 Tax=Pontibacillus yanchengensis Y32 TaxID=1385514 RepID=A0A0A2TXE0_9BACI|nr:hypothetical protein N782_21170 [Pontibacillus yanchengensis Y32]